MLDYRRARPFCAAPKQREPHAVRPTRESTSGPVRYASSFFARASRYATLCVAASDQPRLPQCRRYEFGEQRMRVERFAFQLGMELDPDEPGVIGTFDDLEQQAVGRHAGEDQPPLLERFA